MLLKHLLYDYERQNRFNFLQIMQNERFVNSKLRPVMNESEPLILTFGITLQQIIDVVRVQFVPFGLNFKNDCRMRKIRWL